MSGAEVFPILISCFCANIDVFFGCGHSIYNLITNPPPPTWQLRLWVVLTLLLTLRKCDFFLNVLENCINAHAHVSSLLNTSTFSCSLYGSQKLPDKIEIWAFFWNWAHLIPTLVSLIHIRVLAWENYFVVTVIRAIFDAFCFPSMLACIFLCLLKHA